MSYQRARGGGGANFEGYLVGAVALVVLAYPGGRVGGGRTGSRLQRGAKASWGPLQAIGGRFARGQIRVGTSGQLLGRSAWPPASSC